MKLKSCGPNSLKLKLQALTNGVAFIAADSFGIMQNERSVAQPENAEAEIRLLLLNQKNPKIP